MIQVGRVLNYLLPKHSSIGIGGLGRFRSSWSMHDAWEVDFVPGADKHSPFLLEYITRQAKISPEQAHELIDRWVSQIHEDLDAHDHVEIPGLGKIVRNNSTLHFLPIGKDMESLDLAEPGEGILQEESHQEEEVVILPEEVDQKEKVAHVVPLETPIRTYAEAEQQITSKEPSQEPVLVQEEEETISKSGSGMFWLVLLMLLVLGYLGIRHFRPQWTDSIEQQVVSWFGERSAQTEPEELHSSDFNTAETLSGVDTYLMQDSLNVQDSLTQRLVADSIARTDSIAALASVASEQEKKITGPYRYEVIVASFASLRQAERYVEEMKQKGRNFAVMSSQMAGNRKKVSWGVYSTEEEANQVLKQVQKEFEAGAWIAKVPNQ